MITLKFERAENGYIVTADGGCQYVAATQEAASAVVKTILRGSFPDEVAPVKKTRKKRHTKKAKPPVITEEDLVHDVDLPNVEVVYDPTSDADN